MRKSREKLKHPPKQWTNTHCCQRFRVRNTKFLFYFLIKRRKRGKLRERERERGGESCCLGIIPKKREKILLSWETQLVVVLDSHLPNQNLLSSSLLSFSLLSFSLSLRTQLVYFWTSGTILLVGFEFCWRGFLLLLLLLFLLFYFILFSFFIFYFIFSSYGLCGRRRSRILTR